MTNFELTRKYFDWSFENPDINSPTMAALYYWLLEKWNRSGSVEKVSITASESMAAIGIKNWRTYIKAFDDLVQYGFIKVIVKSQNQYTCTVIAIVKNTMATTKALDKALQLQGVEHSNSTSKGKASINKPLNHETNKPLNNKEIDFEKIWDIYNKKHGDKEKLKAKVEKLSVVDFENMMAHIPKYVASTPDIQFRKNFQTYINNKSWNDEIIISNQKPVTPIKEIMPDSELEKLYHSDYTQYQRQVMINANIRDSKK